MNIKILIYTLSDSHLNALIRKHLKLTIAKKSNYRTRWNWVAS